MSTPQIQELYKQGSLSTTQLSYLDTIIDAADKNKMSLLTREIDLIQDIINTATPAQEDVIERLLAEHLNQVDYDRIYNPDASLPKNSVMCEDKSTSKACKAINIVFYKPQQNKVFVAQDTNTGIWRFPHHKFHPAEYTPIQTLTIALEQQFNLDPERLDITEPMVLHRGTDYVFFVKLIPTEDVQYSHERFVSDWVNVGVEDFNAKFGAKNKYNSVARAIAKAGQGLVDTLKNI